MSGRTIFWPPGPLPFKKASSISASLMTGRGGRGFVAMTYGEIVKGLENRGCHRGHGDDIFRKA